MTKRKTGLNPLAYTGVRASTPPNIQAHDRSPTPNDYYGFVIGDLWIDISNVKETPSKAPTANDIWMLVSKNRTVDNQALDPSRNATWVSFGDGLIRTLSDDNDVKVNPDNTGDIGLVGDNFISVISNPNDNELAITAQFDPSDITTEYRTDDGNDVEPQLNRVNVFGGNGITTAGAGNTITINADDVLSDLEFQLDAGTIVQPINNRVKVFGSGSVDTSGAGDTITINSDGAETLTGDTGGAVGTDAQDNINILGGGGIDVAGDPASNTLTVSTTPAQNQSSFFAFMSTNANNVIGGTNVNYTIPFDTTDYDRNNDFDTVNHQFVAPANGVYSFTVGITVDDITDSMTDGLVSIVTDSDPLGGNVFPVATYRGDPATYSSKLSLRRFRTNHTAIFELNAGNVVYIDIMIQGAASNTANIITNVGSLPEAGARTWFSGVRIR